MTSYSEFALTAVPEFLQIPAYATAIANAEKPSSASDGLAVSAAVARQMNDQSILYEPSRAFAFVLSESALRYKAGPPEVMRAQAEKITSVATLPNVSVAVLPCPAISELVIRSGFAIYEAPEDALVVVELLAGQTVFASGSGCAALP